MKKQNKRGQGKISENLTDGTNRVGNGNIENENALRKSKSVRTLEAMKEIEMWNEAHYKGTTHTVQHNEGKATKTLRYDRSNPIKDIYEVPHFNPDTCVVTYKKLDEPIMAKRINKILI
jgi:hypothetical protein